MKDFIYELYQNDNFTLWLTIALVVLIILFVIVYFFGKKDEKLEETRRLQKIELDAFKKEEENSKKIEVKEEPKIEEKEEIRPIEVVNEEVNVTEFKPSIEDTEEEIELPKVNVESRASKPLFSDHEEEESPISINELPEIKIDEKDEQIESGLSNLEAIKNEFNNIDIPEIKEEIVPEQKPVFKSSPQIFSSVFVNKKDENISNNNTEEVVTKIEEKEEKSEPLIKTFIIEDDDDEMDLPTLKKDEESVKPLVSDENDKKSSLLDDVNGEIYELK